MMRITKILNSRWAALMLGLLAVLVIAAFSLYVPSTFTPSQVLIIGDSITEKPAMAQNAGNEGWWQYLLAGKNDMFKFSAESGSGYAAKGNRGTTFYDRLPDIARTKPKAIIIAGGVNDRNAVNAGSAIKKYFDTLARVLRQNDMQPSDVYVFVPRPTGVASNVAGLVKSNANRIGAKFITTDSYTATYDGIHPNSIGAKVIEQSFAKNSDFDERLK